MSFRKNNDVYIFLRRSVAKFNQPNSIIKTMTHDALYYYDINEHVRIDSIIQWSHEPLVKTIASVHEINVRFTENVDYFGKNTPKRRLKLHYHLCVALLQYSYFYFKIHSVFRYRS